MPFNRSLGVAASQAANRIQSLVFAASESLVLLATRLGLKEPIPLTVQPTRDILQREWPSIDMPLACNLLANFPPRGESVVIDVDIDLHKIDPNALWTDREEELSERVAVQAQTVLEMMLGTEFRYVLGRSSQGGRGHIYLRIEGTKGDVEQFRQRTIAPAIRMGDFAFKIEARLPPVGKVPADRGIMLPGSIYPARTGHGVDPIVWHRLDTTLTLSDVWPKLVGLRPDLLADAIYAATLAVVAIEHWTEGNRHDAALRLTGILARDIVDELLTEGQAKALLQTICTLAGDTDPQDRLKALETSVNRLISGGVVSGFQAFRDFFGNGATDTLTQLRGKGDPTAFDTLRDLVVYAQITEGDADVYIDLDALRRGHGGVVNTLKAIRNHYNTDPRFPPIKAAKKKLALIDALLNSPRLRKVYEAQRFPGIEPGTMMRVIRGVPHVATEEEILNEACILNIGAGYATALVEEPDPEAMEIWLQHWKRFLDPLCHSDDANILRLERAIALKIKHPLYKLALGICMTGGGGIGKTALWLTILPKILGNVTGSMSLNPDRSAYFASDLPGRLFLLADEADLSSLKTDMIEAVKDLMKNPTARINVKYGDESTVANYAIPTFTTNNPHPSLTIKGQRERSLFVIQGDTKENRGLNDKQWSAYTDKIKEHVTAFVAALNDQAVCEAALYYFMHFDIDLKRVALVETSPDGGFSDLTDPRDALGPVEEIVVQMLENGKLHPSFIEHDIMMPFKMDWMIAAIRKELKVQGRSARLTPHSVTKAINALFRDPEKRDDKQEPALGKDQPGGNRPNPDKSASNTRPQSRPELRYFTIGYGLLLKRLKQNYDIEITPVFDIGPEDMGPRKPSNADFWNVATMMGPIDRL